MSKPNPTSAYGDRNFDCPLYDRCLNVAAVERWESFTCLKCPFYRCFPTPTLLEYPLIVIPFAGQEAQALHQNIQDEAQAAGRPAWVIILARLIAYARFRAGFFNNPSEKTER